jgi:hypothetical protein
MNYFDAGKLISTSFSASCLAATTWVATAIPLAALPAPEETPEEILRSEIITEARSPVDGKPLTAAEYAALQAELQVAAPSRPEVPRPVERSLNLLRLRQFIKTFFPFIPVP